MFQLCFGKRFNFFYTAATEVIVYVIKKKHFKQLIEAYPKFERAIKQKAFTWYYRSIYQPLMTKKNQDIAKLDKRSDYAQVIAITDLDNQNVKACLR